MRKFFLLTFVMSPFVVLANEPPPASANPPQTKIETLKVDAQKQEAFVATPKVAVTPGVSSPQQVNYVATQQITTDSRINLVFDRAKVLQIPKGVGSVIVGNPLIADVTVQTNGIAILTGKGNGTTNLIALDMKGNTVFERLVTVKSAQEQVVSVYRADNRETLTCNPRCSRAPTVGDAVDVFDSTFNQANNRSGVLGGAGRAPDR